MPSLKSGSLPQDVIAEKGGRFTPLKPHAPPLSSGPAPLGAPYHVARALSHPPLLPLLAGGGVVVGVGYTGGGTVPAAPPGGAAGGGEGDGVGAAWA